MAGAEQQVDLQLESPGQILKAARQAAGISRSEMAQKLNWVSCYVEAIEEDRYDVFSSRAFATGYLRSYGRYLDVPEDRYLGAHREMLKENGGKMSREPLERISPPRQVVNSGGYALLVAAVAIVVIVGVLWWIRGDGEPAAQVSTDVVEPTPIEVLAAATNDVSAPTMSADFSADSQTAQSSNFSNMPASDDLPVDAASELAFVFTAECWAEVRDGSGELLHADLHQQGDTLSVSGIPPFDILLGDATAARVSYRGAPVEFQPVESRRHISFSVGEAL